MVFGNFQKWSNDLCKRVLGKIQEIFTKTQTEEAAGCFLRKNVVVGSRKVFLEGKIRKMKKTYEKQFDEKKALVKNKNKTVRHAVQKNHGS